MNKSTLLIFLIAFPLLSTYSYGQTTEQKIDSLFTEYNNKPGYAVAIYKNGEIDFQKGYGLANLEYDIKISPKSVFDIASISKQFTAFSILLLEQEGKLNLDDPIHKFIPELPIYKEGKVTVRQVLYHTSGIKEYIKFWIATGHTYDDFINERMAINVLSKVKTLNFKPGTQYDYSNSNYLILARIVREVSDISIGEFVEKNIFEPLEMNDSFIMEDQNRVVKNRAVSYYANSQDVFKRNYFYNYAVGGAGQLNTTVQDFFKWNENFKTFKVGNKDLFDKMLISGTFDDGTQTEEGIGLEVEDYKGLKSFGYEGWFGGTVSKYLRFPNQDFALFMVGNNSGFDMDLFYSIADIYLKDSFKTTKSTKIETQKKVKTTKLSVSNLKSYEGTYWQNEQNSARKIYVKNDTLRFQSDSNLLLPIGESKFVLEEGNSQTQSEFTTDKNGQKVFRLNFENGTNKDYVLYKPVSYNTTELENFTGKYFNADFGVTYDLSIQNEKVVIYINGLGYTYIEPIMKNMFSSNSYGSFYFKENSSNQIIGFEYLGLKFERE
jgi:CubicO group peptidase (beta-lactamase class C family)